MLAPDEQPTQAPDVVKKDADENTRKSPWVWIMAGSVLVVLMVSGAVGLVTTTRDDDEDMNSSLRGNNGNDTQQEKCPTNMQLLAEGGTAQQVFDDLSTSSPPDCKVYDDANPQKAIYFAWKAPQTGHVTLAETTVLVDAACACVTESGPMTRVMEGDLLRVWVPFDQQEQILGHLLEFTVQACPGEGMDMLDENGMIPNDDFERYDITGVVALPPGCEDPQELGTFFAYKAPADGQITLIGSTRVVEECQCTPTSSTFDVKAGEIMHIWTLLKKNIQPLEFAPTVVETSKNHQPDHSPTGLVSSACPTNYDFEGTIDGGLFVESTVMSPRPVCDGEGEEFDESEQGVYLDWLAPSAGQVTPASWAVFVDPQTCTCLDLKTDSFHVDAGQLLRSWGPVRAGQPFVFVPDE